MYIFIYICISIYICIYVHTHRVYESCAGDLCQSIVVSLGTGKPQAAYDLRVRTQSTSCAGGLRQLIVVSLETRTRTTADTHTHTHTHIHHTIIPLSYTGVSL